MLLGMLLPTSPGTDTGGRQQRFDLCSLKTLDASEGPQKSFIARDFPVEKVFPTPLEIAIFDALALALTTIDNSAPTS